VQSSRKKGVVIACKHVCAQSVTFLVIALATTPAFAQKSPRRPGLWEVTTRTLLDGQPRERSTNLDKLSKQERDAVLAQMRSNGIRLISDTKAGRVIQVCVSQEQARKEPEFFGPTLRAVGCNQQEVARQNGGKTVQFEFTCQGKFVGRGKGETTLDSAESYFGWTETRTTLPDGMIKPIDKPMLVRNEIKGRWLRERCPPLTQEQNATEGKTKPKAKTP
jgi:hypothetical protein